jgi:hypothetical protein
MGILHGLCSKCIIYDYVCASSVCNGGLTQISSHAALVHLYNELPVWILSLGSCHHGDVRNIDVPVCQSSPGFAVGLQW